MKCNYTKPGNKNNFFLHPQKRVWSKILLSLISCLLSLASLAQDIHFTQYNFSPLNENPANTNLFDGDMRFVGNFKNQWQSVPVSYNTASASMDMNYVTLKNNDRIGGGFLFYYDQAGDSKFTSLNVAYSMSSLYLLATRSVL
jgi:hypothetical protein